MIQEDPPPTHTHTVNKNSGALIIETYLLKTQKKTNGDLTFRSLFWGGEQKMQAALSHKHHLLRLHSFPPLTAFPPVVFALSLTCYHLTICKRIYCVYFAK